MQLTSTVGPIVQITGAHCDSVTDIAAMAHTTTISQMIQKIHSQ